jgi:hypothetical protein
LKQKAKAEAKAKFIIEILDLKNKKPLGVG